MDDTVDISSRARRSNSTSGINKLDKNSIQDIERRIYYHSESNDNGNGSDDMSSVHSFDAI